MYRKHSRAVSLWNGFSVVSPGAPYHHFDDKVGLLGALAAEGFDALFEMIQVAVNDASTPRKSSRLWWAPI